MLLSSIDPVMLGNILAPKNKINIKKIKTFFILYLLNRLVLPLIFISYNCYHYILITLLYLVIKC